MRRFVFLIIPCLLVLQLVFGDTPAKKAYIITGPESSGSVFISRVIAYVLGKDAFYKQWDGLESIGKVGEDLVIVHLSQPSYFEEQYYSLAYFRELFADYDLYFILTTRDVNVVKRSKKLRFERGELIADNNQKISKEILREIMQKEKFFIWNYETQIYLGEAYFKLLYDFLGVDSNFFPDDIFDGNQKYLSNN